MTNAQDKLVSVIVPVYNGEKYIEDTINSVLSQTYTDWELIVVDDGSSDGTRDKVRRFLSERVRLVEFGENQGAAKARNAGIELARGRYVCFLDADDLWMSEKLERQVAFMKRTGAVFAFSGYEFADATGRPNGKIVRVSAMIDYRRALRNTTIWTSTVMFDMEKLSKEDILMPKVPSEDTATWWKVLKKVGCAYGLDEALAIYRRGGRSLSSNKLVAMKRIWKLYRKVEGLGVGFSSVNFAGWAVNAVRRRV